MSTRVPPTPPSTPSSTNDAQLRLAGASFLTLSLDSALPSRAHGLPLTGPEAGGTEEQVAIPMLEPGNLINEELFAKIAAKVSV